MNGTKKMWTPLLCGLGMFLLILDAKTALNGAREGILLCLKTVVPSLFPFFIFSVLLTGSLVGMSLPFLRPLGTLCGIPQGAETLLLVGLLGGYPVGAQCIAQSWQSGQLDKADAHRMLGFCNNAGPAFLFGMAGSLFNNWKIPWVLWGIHIVSALLVGILLPGRSGSIVRIRSEPALTVPQAMERSLKIMAGVCGWVILFRVILSILDRWCLWLLPVNGQVLITGLLELSNGCCALAALPCQGDRFLIFSLFLALGGLCVGMQTKSVTGILGTGDYFPGKALQAIFSLLLASIVKPLLFSWESQSSVPIWIPLILAVCGGAIVLFLRNRKKSSSNPAASGV